MRRRPVEVEAVGGGHSLVRRFGLASCAQDLGGGPVGGGELGIERNGGIEVGKRGIEILARRVVARLQLSLIHLSEPTRPY